MAALPLLPCLHGRMAKGEMGSDGVVSANCLHILALNPPLNVFKTAEMFCF